MASLVRRKTEGVVKAFDNWLEPFKIPEDPNKTFLERYRDHVEKLREERKTPEFRMKSVWATTKMLRFLMAFQAPTMIYVYTVYIVPHTFEDYSLWTQFYMKLLCWYILFNGMSNYLLVIFTDCTAHKDDPRFQSRINQLLQTNEVFSSDMNGQIMNKGPIMNNGPILNKGPIMSNGHIMDNGDKVNGHSVSLNMDTVTKDEGLQWKYCEKCNINMPPRCHHCKFCNKCMLKRDHHCNMVGNCVGYNNQRFFIVLTFYAMITGLLGAFFTMKYISEALWPTMYSWTDLFLPITIFRYLFGSLPGFQLLVTLHVYLEIPFGMFGIIYLVVTMMHAILGMTPYEVEKKLPLKNSNTVGQNFRQIFGSYWLLNFVFPVFWLFKEHDDGIHYENIKIDYTVKEKAKDTKEQVAEEKS